MMSDFDAELIQINPPDRNLMLHLASVGLCRAEEDKMLSHDDSGRKPSSRTAFLTSPAGLVLMGFLAIAGAYLWMEHRAHLLGALVWLPLGACLLMHVFMHHGHGGHGQKSGSGHRPSGGAAS